jgi:hypothetical protein
MEGGGAMRTARRPATGIAGGAEPFRFMLMHVFQATTAMALLLAGAFAGIPLLMVSGLLVFLVSAISIWAIMR